MRTDTDPLISRFPALGQPTSVRWQSGTLGDDRVPGPSTYWIDAVVTLDPGTADSLRAEYAPAAGGPAPDLVAEVAAAAPSGELIRSDSLDSALSRGGWDVDAWLVEGQDVLVLSGIGE